MDINFSVKGDSNKNLILLHGWGGSSASLAGLQDELSVLGYKVYNLDLPGFGQTPQPEEAFNQDQFIASIVDFIQYNQINKPILIGHSFGGKTSIGLALKYPELIESIVLINASGIKPRNSLKRALFIIPAKLLGALFSLPILNKIKPLARKIFYKGLVREQDYLKASKVMQDSMKNVLKINYDEQLAQISVPVLLVWGEKDTYTPLWNGQKFAKLIPGAKLQVVRDATHNLPIKQPKLVAQYINDFIK